MSKFSFISTNFKWEIFHHLIFKKKIKFYSQFHSRMTKINVRRKLKCVCRSWLSYSVNHFLFKAFLTTKKPIKFICTRMLIHQNDYKVQSRVHFFALILLINGMHVVNARSHPSQWNWLSQVYCECTKCIYLLYIDYIQ